MSAKQKKSLKEIKKIPPHALLRLIDKAKKYLKQDEVMKNIFKEYNTDIAIIDYIPVTFSDLDVSAKTDHGIIYLSFTLLEDGDFFKDYSYLIHEITHFLQQTCNDKPTQSSDEGEYLDNKFEQEAFTNQVEYISDHFGENEAENYVDDLLEHHEIDNKKEKKEKKEIFLSKI